MITILTPTFNREHLLPRLLESLKSQSTNSFEWIIIDDGSEDNTKKLVTEWALQKNRFDIRYYRQRNGGKHRAINYGINKAKYPYCFIVDSDDFLTDDAIKQICKWLKDIEGNDDFAGVAGLKGYINRGIIGGYPRGEKFENYIDATNLERRKYNLTGDKAEVYRTDLLKKYPFPEFEGENFITESVVWDAIARDGYKIRWFNKIIYLAEYLDDGLTKSGDEKFLKNFEGYTFVTRQRIKLHGKFKGLAYVGKYFLLAKEKGYTFSGIAERLQLKKFSLLTAILVYYIKNLLKRIQFVRK